MRYDDPGAAVFAEAAEHALHGLLRRPAIFAANAGKFACGMWSGPCYRSCGQSLVQPRDICRNESNSVELQRSGGDFRDCARRTDIAVHDGRA
jgi:hypothetical protein